MLWARMGLEPTLECALLLAPGDRSKWELVKGAAVKAVEDAMGGRRPMDVVEEDEVEGREKVMASSRRFCSGRSGSAVLEDILRMR